MGYDSRSVIVDAAGCEVVIVGRGDSVRVALAEVTARRIVDAVNARSVQNSGDDEV